MPSCLEISLETLSISFSKPIGSERKRNFGSLLVSVAMTAFLNTLRKPSWSISLSSSYRITFSPGGMYGMTSSSESVDS